MRRGTAPHRISGDRVQTRVQVKSGRLGALAQNFRDRGRIVKWPPKNWTGPKLAPGLPIPLYATNGWNQRNLVLAVRSGEGLLSVGLRTSLSSVSFVT